LMCSAAYYIGVQPLTLLPINVLMPLGVLVWWFIDFSIYEKVLH
jgi:hypothetical protein